MLRNTSNEGESSGGSALKAAASAQDRAGDRSLEYDVSFLHPGDTRQGINLRKQSEILRFHTTRALTMP